MQTATLRAGGSWSAPVTLGTGAVPSLAVDPAGAMIATWSTSHHVITAAAGTVGSGWSASVALGPGSAYKQQVRLSLGADGQATALWTNNDNALAVTRSAGGAWTAPTTLGAGSPAGVAQDAAGDSVGLWIQTVYNGQTWTYSLYSSRHTPAGGWAAATLLAVLPASSGSVAAAPAGSFVVVYASSAITSPPGQGFGAPVTVASGSTAVMVAAAPGHALTVWRGGGATNATVATEPLT